ncbi:MAG: type II toxin-antitoxin system HicB family antitoxin [Candidatus Kapabacteria bacterium]|nr:type II toxin-antitoxin system HicB family antitoxin [Candidatus Kapabacteria bacterium]
MNTVQYCVVVQRSDNGYCAYSPDVPGCIAADDSFEATLQLMAEALEFHLEGMLEHGEQVPEPKDLRSHLDSGTWEFTDEDIYAYVSVAIPEPA